MHKVEYCKAKTQNIYQWKCQGNIIGLKIDTRL